MEFLSAGFDGWLRAKPGEVRSAAARALRRTATAVQGSAIALFRERGVGRRVFGPKPADARKLIQRGKLRLRHGVMEQPIKLKGMAAIQERGGTFRAHVIAPKNRQALAFPGLAGGLQVTRQPVNHPGAQHPAMPYAQRAVALHVGKLQEELNKELQKLVGKAAA